MGRFRGPLLLCLLVVGRSQAGELWFLPYEPDERTVCLYHLEGDGEVAKSAASLPVEGSLRGGATRGEGRFGKGLVLRGGKQCLRLGKHEALRMGRNEAFTVELWCKPLSGGEAGLISLGVRFYLKLHPGRRTAVFGYRAASFPIRWQPCANVRWRRRTWQHVALVHDERRRMRLYLDGVLAAEVRHADEGDYAKGGGAVFGAHDGWAWFFRGSLDEIRISRGVRHFAPVLSQSMYLAGESVALQFEPGRLPAAVRRLRAEILGRGRKSLWRAEYELAAVPAALLPAEKLPGGRNTFRLTFLDAAGESVASVDAPVEFAGPRLERIEARLAACREAAGEGGALLSMELDEIARFVRERKLDAAELLLQEAEHVARRATQGETAARARLREAVRAGPFRNRVQITMSWNGRVDEAAAALPWAKRVGANELVSPLSRADPEGIRLWKQAGYRTVALSGFPIHDRDWLRAHPDDAQFGYWANDPTAATGATLRMKIVSPTWGGEAISTVHDPREHWVVRDVTAGRSVPASQWRYDGESREVVVSGAEPGHRYRVYFMIRTHSTGDPLRPRFAAHALEHLDRLVAPFEGVLDTYWFDDLGFAYPGPVPQGAWDWESYALAAHPENQRRFTQATGIAFDPQWLVMPPRTIEVVPDRRYLAWMAWVQGQMRAWLPKPVEVLHRRGMRGWLYWGDCHVGIEPFLGSIAAGRLDEIDKPSGDAVTARALVDFPGGVYRRMRVDWLHGHLVASPKGPARLRQRWDQAKRGLLMKPVRGLYWMPFGNVARLQSEALREAMAATVGDISDEFRLIGERLAGHAAYTHDIDVYVVHSWGKVYSWRPWGAPILVHLSDLPLRIHFASFAEIERGGVPADADVLFGHGVPGSSWSGGHFWRSARLVGAIEEFVRRGGGLVALQAWSHVADPKPRWALGELLGVTGEGTQRFEAAKADESLVADVGDVGTQAAAGSEALVRTRGGRLHWIAAGLPAAIGGLRSGMRVSRLAQDGQTLFAVRPAQGEATPGVVVRQAGKGRVVYVAGWSPDFAFTRLVRRSLLWAARRQADDGKLRIDGRERLFLYAYPRARLLAAFSANAERVAATVRCSPDILGLKPQAPVRLLDAVTGEHVFGGAAKALGKGIRLKLVPSCVRLLAVRE